MPSGVLRQRRFWVAATLIVLFLIRGADSQQWWVAATFIAIVAVVYWRWDAIAPRYRGWAERSVVVVVALLLLGEVLAAGRRNPPTGPSTASLPPRATASLRTSIPGLTAADIKVNLQNRQFTCTGPSSGADGGIVYECKDGSQYRASWRGRNPSDVYSIDSTALGVTSAEAADYLAYIASVPCTGCQPSQATEWVKANIARDSQTTIGPVHYHLYPSGGAWILEMTAA